jgi:Transglycosylase SLT domain
MPAPLAATAGALAGRRLARHRFAPLVAAVFAGLLAVLVLMLVGVFAALFGLRPMSVGSFHPSALARAEIPAAYLRLYTEAGRRYGVDPWVLAAIGWVETMHGRSRQAGVGSGVNFAGCCAGPMQFNVSNGPPSTWESYGVDGDGDGRRSPYDPADAIPAAARYLRAAGAPGDYRAALFAYNHADWYVAQVLAKAADYRGSPRSGSELVIDTADVRELLRNSRVVLTPIQRTDLLAGGIDPRLIATLAAIGRRHTVVITALRADHYPGTNHEAGRAMDIGAVDGQLCDGRRTGPCARLVHEFAAVEGEQRSTELIYCWDPDGPADARGFARTDHCDHVHVGWDG